MKERETQAAASWRFVTTRTNQNAEVMRFMKPSFDISLSKYAWLSSMRIDHPVATPEEHSSSNLRV
jgi:hypothetical protein